MTDALAPETEHVDVLIVGAGLSGIGAGYHLQTNLPGKSYTILEARERERRHLGPVPVPGRAVGLRHVHARLPLPARGEQQGDRRRAVDPGLHPRDRERPTGSTVGSASATASSARVVDRRRPLDRHRAAHRHRRDRHVHRRLPVRLQRLLPLRPGIPAGLPRHRALHGPDRASAVLGRGPRLLGQARCGDRQRRNRGDAGPRDGRRAEHVTMLQRSPSYIMSLPAEDPSPRCCAGCSRRSSPTRSCAGRTCCSRWRIFQLSRRRPKVMKALIRKAQERGCRPATTSTRIQAQLRPVGPAHVPGSRRRPVRGDRDGKASVVTDRIETFTETGLELDSGARARGRLIVTATGLNLLVLGGIAAERRRRRGRHPAGDELQGHDARWRAEHGLRRRLHERVVDAAGRPRLRVRLPGARPHGRQRVPAVHAPQPRRLDHHRAVHRSDVGIRDSRDQPVPQAGVRAPWRQYQNYTLDMARCAIARSRTGCSSSRARQRPVAAAGACRRLGRSPTERTPTRRRSRSSRSARAARSRCAGSPSAAGCTCACRARPRPRR